jgi:RimJ/RimL family protein N-acetyltransferase
MATPLPAPIPILDTERLLLRAHTPEDFAACAAMWADPEVTRHIGGRPFTGEEVWARVLRYAGHWSWLGYGFWAIVEKSSGRFVGEAGFADFKREMEPALAGEPEAGWVLAPWAHGRGYATEAVRAALQWADARFESARTVCLIDPGNARSIRVAEKCGYRRFGSGRYKGAETLLFERPPR